MERIAVGKIVNTHGVKGELKIFPFTDKPAQFKKWKRVFVVQGENVTEYPLLAARVVKNTVLVKLEGIDDMNGALALRDAMVEIPQSGLPILPEDEYYVTDLIGMSVFDEADMRIGTITDVLETGSNDCYNIKRDSGAEFYLPALKTVVLQVDVAAKKMIVRIPEGL